MTIGFDSSRAFISEKTGTEIYSYQILKALAKIDRKNQYIVYLRGVQNDKIRWPGNFEFKELNWPRLWTQIGLSKQTFSDKLDVLFIPAHTSPLIHKRGLKTVVTVHDLGAEYLPRMHQLKQRLYLKLITRYQLRSASKLIAVSYATKDDLVKRVGIEPGKIEVIYEGYDKELFKPAKDEKLVNSLKQYDLVPGEYFLFVGTVQPRKNLERLIKAYSMYVVRGPVDSSSGHKKPLAYTSDSNHSSQSQVARLGLGSRRASNTTASSHFLVDSDFAAPPLTTHNADDFTDPKLVVVGNRGWMADSIYKLPKKLGIENQVIFLGRVSDKDLPALYSGAIALTFPSLFEGFGLPILEAQACGCPVLTSDVSSMPEVGGKGALYVDPYSTDDIVRGIREIGEKRGKLIKAGFDNIKRFSWEKCATQTLSVFENLKL